MSNQERKDQEAKLGILLGELMLTLNDLNQPSDFRRFNNAVDGARQASKLAAELECPPPIWIRVTAEQLLVYENRQHDSLPASHMEFLRCSGEVFFRNGAEREKKRRGEVLERKGAEWFESCLTPVETEDPATVYDLFLHLSRVYAENPSNLNAVVRQHVTERLSAWVRGLGVEVPEFEVPPGGSWVPDWSPEALELFREQGGCEVMPASASLKDAKRLPDWEVVEQYKASRRHPPAAQPPEAQQGADASEEGKEKPKLEVELKNGESRSFDVEGGDPFRLAQKTDWPGWRETASWALDDAACLVCGVNPDYIFVHHLIGGGTGEDLRSWRAQTLYDHAEQAIQAGDLDHHTNGEGDMRVKPREFVSWAAARGWEVPPPLEALVVEVAARKNEEKSEDSTTSRTMTRVELVNRFCERFPTAERGTATTRVWRAVKGKRELPEGDIPTAVAIEWLEGQEGPRPRRDSDYDID
ncbi:MAG: hypothetical protein GY851_06610 [bacterium]|nr:hypothetical protein [bacterium]